MQSKIENEAEHGCTMTDCALQDIFTEGLHEVEYQLWVFPFMSEYKPTPQEQLVVVHEPFTQILAASQVSHQAFVPSPQTIFLQRAVHNKPLWDNLNKYAQVSCLLFLRDGTIMPE